MVACIKKTWGCFRLAIGIRMKIGSVTFKVIHKPGMHLSEKHIFWIGWYNVKVNCSRAITSHFVWLIRYWTFWSWKRNILGELNQYRGRWSSGIVSLSTTLTHFNCFCHLSVEKLWKMQLFFMFPKHILHDKSYFITPATKMTTIWGLWKRDHFCFICCENSKFCVVMVWIRLSHILQCYLI